MLSSVRADELMRYTAPEIILAVLFLSRGLLLALVVAVGSSRLFCGLRFCDSRSFAAKSRWYSGP